MINIFTSDIINRRPTILQTIFGATVIFSYMKTVQCQNKAISDM